MKMLLDSFAKKNKMLKLIEKQKQLIKNEYV